MTGWQVGKLVGSLVVLVLVLSFPSLDSRQPRLQPFSGNPISQGAVLRPSPGRNDPSVRQALKRGLENSGLVLESEGEAGSVSHLGDLDPLVARTDASHQAVLPVVRPRPRRFSSVPSPGQKPTGNARMGYPLDSGNPNILWLGSRGLGVPVGDDRSIRRWVHGDCLLHKAAEEFSPAA